ncbi:flagellar hook-associated protein 3 FlgL [Natronospira proteinivora]|uniref:Flagellar hook-associated protein 3 FlgL n=1 Tax=Natronospira proteinivora TaxID=1807133 RepID=A0ABT1G546_9GAMM|nr:flagellar hook-associated protein FlgL [Natronospira proteinivora]MCP1726424.1 flagellar hook-associated protein 3 FlgL [Natronospira proteinivora]
MRVSTTWFNLNATQQMQNQQGQLAKTQEQAASGKRIVRPSDDPIGSVQALELGRALQKTDQYDRNATMAQNRLQTQESILDEAGNIMQRVRELTVQGANGSQDNDSRSFIAAELKELRSALVDMANTKDASDNFIFAGFQGDTQPFSPTSDGVVYNGDSGQRTLQIGPNRTVTDGNPGAEVFMNIREGNGTFKAEAGAANEGSGVIKNTSVRDLQQWTGDTYEIEILADGEYEVRDSDGTVVESGEFQPGETIQFSGIELTIDGTPEEGDQFEVSPSQNSSVFNTLDRLIDAFDSPVSNSRDRTQQLNEVNRSLDDIDQGVAQMLEVRAETGARLKAIDDQVAVNDGSRLDLETTKSGIEDLDYAEAITRLNQQQVGLQAAQQAYVRTQGLSLFNFM